MTTKVLLTVTLLSSVFFLSVIGDDDEDNLGRNGVYASIRGFLDDMGKVTGEVMTGVKKLAKGIRHVQEFLDSTVEENCVFECPDGSNPKPNPNYLPESNGCGTFGLEEYTHDLLHTSAFVPCCDSHDLCYGKCLSDMDECDLKFKKCLYKVCSTKKEKGNLDQWNYKGCQAGAKLMYTGTTALGCQPYIAAQREACLCPTSRKKDEF